VVINIPIVYQMILVFCLVVFNYSDLILSDSCQSFVSCYRQVSQTCFRQWGQSQQVSGCPPWPSCNSTVSI